MIITYALHSHIGVKFQVGVLNALVCPQKKLKFVLASIRNLKPMKLPKERKSKSKIKIVIACQINFQNQRKKATTCSPFSKIKDISEKDSHLDEHQWLKSSVPTAWSISFPKTNLVDDNVEYQVNSIFMKQLEEIEALEAEALEGDL